MSSKVSPDLDECGLTMSIMSTVDCDKSSAVNSNSTKILATRLTGFQSTLFIVPSSLGSCPNCVEVATMLGSYSPKIPDPVRISRPSNLSNPTNN